MLYFIIQECHTGFTGPNCTINCRYPGFGKECQNVCNCNKSFCDPSTGCKGLFDNSNDLQKAKYLQHASYTFYFIDGSPTISPISTKSNIKKTSVSRLTTEKIRKFQDVK